MGLFGKRKTTKPDVIMAIAGAVVGIWKAHDTITKYKVDHEVEEKEEKK